MRLAFLGTPEFAVPVLEALAREHEVTLVVSRADRRRTRRGHAEPSPVKRSAQDLGIPTTERARDVIGWDVELGVVVAFGRIIKPDVLQRVPMVNLHLSLLPRWRGAAPVQRAILAGDHMTGVCLMSLDEGLDTGPVHGCEPAAIGDEETADELTGRLISLGTGLLLDHLAKGLGPGTSQVGEPTYAEKITNEDLRLRWERPVVELLRQVRVGGAWCLFRDMRFEVVQASLAQSEVDATPGEVVREGGEVLVGTGAGLVQLERVKPEGRRVLAAADWVNGARLTAGERLG